MKLIIEREIFDVFSSVCHPFRDTDCYLVGGIVRDTLIGLKSKDIDIATACSPARVHMVYPDGLYFQKYGTTTLKEKGYHVTIASLRKESGYEDFRHPSRIEFVKDIEMDYLRRDFTINALYADENLEVLDPSLQGLRDLEEKTIRMIGSPEKRLMEDPLRMIRAFRFADSLSFRIQPELEEFILSHLYLLKRLKASKVIEEVNKLEEGKREHLIRTLSLDSLSLK